MNHATMKSMFAAVAALCAAAVFTPSFAADKYWVGGASGDWSGDNWADVSGGTGGAWSAGDTAIFDSAAAVTVSGASTMNVAEVQNTGAGVVTFSCPVQFTGTYRVTATGGRVKFPGGATATCPDNEMRTASASDNTLILDGDFTFTADWIVNNIAYDRPWTVVDGAAVRGTLFTGVQSSHYRILRIDEGGYAYFNTVTNGYGIGNLDIDGTLEVAGDCILNATGGQSDLGIEGNVGTIKANRLARDGSSAGQLYIPNLRIGSGGVGCIHRDWLLRFMVDTTVTATADFEFLGVYNSGATMDWGILVWAGKTLTINVPEGMTVTAGAGIRGLYGGKIRKTGAGVLLMTNVHNGSTGFTKNYGEGTVVDEGTLRVAANGQLGPGGVEIGANGRVEILSGVTVSNRISGEGTLYLEDGATLATGGAGWNVGKVEFASASAAVTVSKTASVTAPYAFITGLSDGDESHFTCSDSPLTLNNVGGALLWTGDLDVSAAFVWNGASGADWSEPSNWLVGGAAPAAAPTSSDTVLVNSANAKIGGSGTLQVAGIVNLAASSPEFACPVQFAGTYIVQSAAAAPVFSGGATATCPDASLTSANLASHTFLGTVNFTSDWQIPSQTAGVPFTVGTNATVNGQKLSAVSRNTISLEVSSGATATFGTITVGNTLNFHLSGGRLVATGDVTYLGNGSNESYQLGYYGSESTGTVEANGFYKNATSGGRIYLYIDNITVGAGGFGHKTKDWRTFIPVALRLTAKDDFTIFNCDSSKTADWCLEFKDATSALLIDTAGHSVYCDSVVQGNGRVVKNGSGTLYMQKMAKTYTGGTYVNGGTLHVALATALGTGMTTVNDGATLEFASAVSSFAYAIRVKSGGVLANGGSISDSSTLTLDAGAILKPSQNFYFDISSGTLTLPGYGAVTVDMTDFDFVNGVAYPVLAGVADGDEAKFAALVPEGIVGAFSVSGGTLRYTATSGGASAGSLFWHPDGDSTWSTEVAAWTNATGEQVSFTPYADATVADAATISITNDVNANNVTIAADGDVALNGAGKIGGPGTLVKTGSGTFTFNATGGLDAQPVIVSNGIFKLGADLSTHALGSAADTSPLVIESGATLDVNFNASGASDVSRNSITHDKLIKIAGDGVDGKGAIVNSTEARCAFGDVELTDDASIGGSKRIDFRYGASYSRAKSRSTLTGEGKCLTVRNTTSLVLGRTDVSLGSILVTDNGVLELEGTSFIRLPGGVRLANGTLSMWSSSGTPHVIAESGTNKIQCRNNNATDSYIGAVEIMPGATLSQSSGVVYYKTPSSAMPTISSGIAYLDGCVQSSGFAIAGANSAEVVRLRQSGTFSGANISCYAFGVGDVSGSTVSAAFNDSTIDVGNLYLAWGGATASLPATAYLSIGPGTTLTAGKICVGDDGTSTSNNIESVMSVDGGTVHLTGDYFYIAYNAPHSDFIINSGTATVDTATIALRSNNAALGGVNTSRFIQNGGTFNYGGAGFSANFEDNTEDGQIVLKGGEMNATTNWSIPGWISTCFKGGGEGWTLNQADGTTATWATALQGDGDVTLNGAATLAGNKEVQGAAGGKWTVGAGFTAGLEGAASLLGGLSIGEGATATVDIATDRSAVFTARDFGANPGNAGCITNRFNKVLGGTTRGTITHDETFLFTTYAAANRPFGNLNFQSTYGLGQFYVEEDKAGEWSFTGICDDWVYIWIDGELTVAPAQGKQGSGTKNLTAGWHSFRHVIIDNGGAFGNAQTAGYKDPTMSDYANFSVKNLKMRPGADCADGENANTVLWSHFKGTTSTVTASNFKNDFAWDFRCITNTVTMLNKYGKTADMAMLLGSTVNRFEGWFLVTAKNAGKTWTFRTRYDDRCALWIDGVDAGLDGQNNSALTYSVALARGWHKFRIQSFDYGGNAGPWGGSGDAVTYQIDGGAQTLFSERTLTLSVCPDGYVQGGVTLASGATLSNGASGAATVYGDVTVADGATGAKISGGFTFDGGTLDFGTVAADVRDLSTVLAFENPAEDFLANVGAIKVAFPANSGKMLVKFGPCGGLTAETLRAKLRVTEGDATLDPAVRIENGEATLLLHRGMMLIVR